MLTDTLGSVVAATNNLSGSGAVLGNQVYGPYGTKRQSKGSVGTDKGFTGQITDSISGLDDYGARYYDPVVGQFVSVDSLQGNLSGMDPYAYVGGNPETRNDPTGNYFVQQGNNNGNGTPSTPTTPWQTSSPPSPYNAPGQTQSTSSPITNTVSGNDNPFVVWKNDAFQARFSFSTMRFIINTLVFRNKGRAVSDAASAVDLVLPVTSDANMLSYLTNIPLPDKDTGSFQAMLSYGKGDAAAVLKGVADGLGVLANVAALVWLTTDLMQQFSGGYKKANWASVIYDASGIASIVLHYLSKALNNEELENVSFVFAVIGTAVALATAAGDLANALSSSINSGTGDQSHRDKNRSFGGGVPPGGMPPVVPGPYNRQGPITPPINNPIMPEPII